MNNATQLLTGGALSATNYANWYSNLANTPLPNGRWEWCHLLAHSLGGADDETNIVAARKGNNSEQLAIESALAMFRTENAFSMQISALRMDNGNGRLLGNVIRYRIICTTTQRTYDRYLDCINAPPISAIHFYTIRTEVVSWCARRLQAISYPIMGTEKLAIRNYLRAKRLR